MDTIEQLLKKNRSYRRFHEEIDIPMESLREIISLTRLAASPANKQPLRYITVNDRKMNEKIFPALTWAAYIKEWQGPEPGERPAAYIVILGDPKQSPFIQWDYGIALQTLLLGCADKGLGGCAIAAFNKGMIRDVLEVPESLEIAAIIALGRPKETVIITEVKNGDIKYYRDENQVHYVPKRSLDELIYRMIPE